MLATLRHDEEWLTLFLLTGRPRPRGTSITRMAPLTLCRTVHGPPHDAVRQSSAPTRWLRPRRLHGLLHQTLSPARHAARHLDRSPRAPGGAAAPASHRLHRRGRERAGRRHLDAMQGLARA